MSKKILERNSPFKEPEVFPWDEGSIKRFKFDPWEVTKLESGGVVWQGDVAFSLEDEE